MAKLLSDLTTVQPFDVHGDSTTVGARWQKWVRSFELFCIGRGVTNVDQKKALMLHCGGTDLQDVYFTFEPKEPGDGENVYSVTQKQLSDYFMPQENVPYERHLFRNMTQNSDETVDQYITRLRQRVEFCKFGDQANEQIRDQVIEKCVSHHLRRKLLERDKTLH